FLKQYNIRFINLILINQHYLDRAIALLSRVTAKVTLERVDRIVCTSSDNEPSLRDHRRHVFTLERSWTVYNSLPSNCPHFFARAVSKRALGHFGLKKARLLCAFTALPLDIAGKSNKLGLPGFANDAQPLFKLRRRDGRWEWADKNGNAVAVEDEGDDTHRMIVTAQLPRTTLDALVALWCCRLWEYSADYTEEVQQGIDRIHSKLKMGKDAECHEHKDKETSSTELMRTSNNEAQQIYIPETHWRLSILVGFASKHIRTNKAEDAVGYFVIDLPSVDPVSLRLALEQDDLHGYSQWEYKRLPVTGTARSPDSLQGVRYVEATAMSEVPTLDSGIAVPPPTRLRDSETFCHQGSLTNAIAKHCRNGNRFRGGATGLSHNSSHATSHAARNRRKI
ncbi:hypothetical protein CHU98_g4233, partial [Xylaria longipes]